MSDVVPSPLSDENYDLGDIDIVDDDIRADYIMDNIDVEQTRNEKYKDVIIEENNEDKYVINDDKSITYKIHDNGARPFTITDYSTDKYIIINDNRDIKAFTNMKFSYLEIFIGKDTHNKNYNGNSIIIKVGLERYIYIGCNMYEFMTDDPIVDYISEIGNSDVPYPYAIGEKNIFLMLECVFFPKNF